MRPVPYGDGYHRVRGVCNFDNPIIDVSKAKRPNDEMSQQLDALLVPSGSMPGCVSTFGVADMVGNIDEWLISESGGKYQSGLMSGHVFGVRNRSRAITVG